MPRVARVGVLLVALAVGAAAWVVHGRAPVPMTAGVSSAALAVASAPQSSTSLLDPLSPTRPAAYDPAARPDAGDWVTARPGFQYSRSPAERDGVEPCATQQVDLSSFSAWQQLAQGQFSAPLGLALDAAGHFDLVIHLHGGEPVRRELARSGQSMVLYTLTLEGNQNYAELFTASRLYQAIVAGVEQALSQRAGRAAHLNHVALSAWSAGFVGVEAALTQAVGKDVDAVILIDGLHAPRGNRAAFEAQLRPFVAYATRAAAGERFMLVSHSSIDPPDFASTTECAHYLIASLGGKPQAVRRADALGLELVESFSRGSFYVRGYAGNDKADHCAQLAVLREAYAALGRRWSGAAIQRELIETK